MGRPKLPIRSPVVSVPHPRPSPEERPPRGRRGPEGGPGPPVTGNTPVPHQSVRCPDPTRTGRFGGPGSDTAQQRPSSAKRRRESTAEGEGRLLFVAPSQLECQRYRWGRRSVDDRHIPSSRDGAVPDPLAALPPPSLDSSPSDSSPQSPVSGVRSPVLTVRSWSLALPRVGCAHPPSNSKSLDYSRQPPVPTLLLTPGLQFPDSSPLSNPCLRTSHWGVETRLGAGEDRRNSVCVGSTAPPTVGPLSLGGGRTQAGSGASGASGPYLSVDPPLRGPCRWCPESRVVG